MTLEHFPWYNPFPNKPWFFTCLQYKSFESTVGKGEIAHNKQFLLCPQCFLPIWRTSSHFHQVEKCRLQTHSVWKGLKLVVWERYNATRRCLNPFPNKPWVRIHQPLFRTIFVLFSRFFNILKHLNVTQLLIG